ncbi:unnamed protein product [Thelazia callipaeda]|uniref:Mediator of RNA polymerase II transcription subunit 23 n=1 Tax=Thelazia callipaeda TaxID=103827 RepID=A0A0N5CU78_THECL|nr:unnamed protein product [Thelazia callipaeda]
MSVSTENMTSASSITAAVGNDAEKLQWIVVNQVEGVQMREMFWDLSKDVDVGELVCNEAVKLLRTMTEEEKAHCCKSSLSLLSNKEEPRYVHYERILSSIFMTACNEGVLSLSDCCELLILSTNFTLTTPMDARKFEYMQKNLHLIDYKGLRNILKLLVVERMQEVPSTITHHHRHMLLPVENMLLTLIDRRLNLLPCLFTITELHRVSSNSRAFLLPRVAKKFNDMFISFRPLTEMVTVIGRSWLYPVATHISFPVSTSSWRLEVTTTRLHQRAHLPYRSELFAPQSSLLYTLLRQPRGKDTISYVMRQNASLTPQRLQCDELLHMIILEAMSEMEKTDTRLDDPANQYQWMNITHTVTFSLLHGNASFSRLLKILNESLSETVYRKGRDELMWVILQYVAVYIDRVSNEEMARVADIYNLLYSDEQTWSGTSHSEVLPKPSESLWRQIQFLQERTADSDPNIQNVADHNAVLAAVANAFSSDMPNFQKLVLTAVDVFLDGSQEEVNTVWHLPHGIISYSKKTPLPLSLIDSLTFHARNHLFQLCLLKLTAMLSVQQTQKLPSPATVDTLVRLAVTTEFEYGVKQVLALLSSTLASVNKNAGLGPAQQDRSRDLLYVLCDILSYRFISYPFPVGSKVNLMLWCYTALGNNQIQMNIALCAALEQVILRFWMWNSPQEMFYLSNAFLGKQGKLASMFNTSNSSYCDPQHGTAAHERQYVNSHVSPELLRCLLLSMFRCLKMTGIEMTTEMIQRCNANFCWPVSVSRVYSSQLTGCTVDDGVADAGMCDELMHRVVQEVHQVQEIIYAQGLAAEDQLLKFFSGERRQTIFCVVYNMLFETKKIHPVVYSVLNSMSNKELTASINKFTDYFVFIFKKSLPSDDQQFAAMIGILNDMVFNLHLISLDRLFTSLVLHPTDDGGTEIAMLIIHSLVGSYSDLHNRITALVHIIPSNKIVNTGAAFFNKMSEYYSQFPELTYREMEAKMRREMQLELGMRPMEQPIVSPELHMPIYYGNIMERILPVVDIILLRAMETVVADQLFTTLLMSFKPCYRYHPQPAAYMYSVLYCLDKTVSHTVRARDFVLEICGQLEDRDGKYALLTPSFISDNHQLSLPSQFCQALVDRILQASNYPHQPPSFAYKDWRFAEMPPVGQALTGACIELLASPHAPSITARSLIDLVFNRPLHQPYATINAVALILTALPLSFQQVFYEHIVSVLDSEALHGDPSACFGSLESECFLLTENQLLTNLALGHAYLQHCNTSSLAALPEFVRDQLAPKLVTEAQLIFVLRLVVPILQRLYDAKERSKQIQDLAVDVYKMTVKVNERVGILKYEDSICDFLYHMKYMYVGDFVKNEAEQAIQRLSPSMRDKLQYISHSQANVTGDLPYKLDPGPSNLLHYIIMEHGDVDLSFSERMKVVRQSTWYWGNMSWRDAEKVLINQLPGTYLVRDSASDRHIFTISYRTESSVHHTRVSQYGGNYCLGGPNSLLKSKSLVSFIEHALQNYGKRKFSMLMHSKSDHTGIELLELNHLLHRHELLPSLKYLCRVVIRNYVDKDLLSYLPLPPNMIRYLQDAKYFVPSCGTMTFNNTILKQRFISMVNPMVMTFEVLKCLKRSCSIFALSSGALPAAISIIRVSGKESRYCLEELTGNRKISPRRLFFANIRWEGELIDQGMAVFLKGPKTATGEDMAEFYVHGSPAVVDCLLNTLAKFDNLRPAKAGEFTRRAFFNGKMTLHDVQSLRHLLAARTQRQRRLALHANSIDEAMEKVRKRLVEIRSVVEAFIDFGDDVEFDWKNIRSSIHLLISDLSSMEKGLYRGTLVINGLSIVILGHTNVGKSSLFNRLVNRDVAIVSDIEGTTRDALEATLHLSSLPVTIVDTAGIRKTPLDAIEAAGIQRTLQRAAEADIVIVVLDSSACGNVEVEVRSVLLHCQLKKDVSVIVVLNKCDLNTVPINSHLSWRIVRTSCTSDVGIDSLFDAVCETIDELCPSANDHVFLSSQQHQLLINKIHRTLSEALKVEDIAIIAELLRDASDYVGEISNLVVNEEILDQIFSSFCIGK